MSIPCVLRSLEPDRHLEAAKNAAEINPKNAPPGWDAANAPTDSNGRVSVDIARYWGLGGVDLTVDFLDSPSVELQRRILQHMNAWGVNANVRFVASRDSPRVRISRFTDADAKNKGGYWSYLGTDILLIPQGEPTLNLEGFTMSTPDAEFFRVVRHEAGHTLGFPHEHMRAEFVTRLNHEKVITAYMRSQQWSEAEVRAQVLTPLSDASILGTAADQTSIMCYQIDGELTVDGLPIEGGTDINDTDHAFAAKIYPKPR